MATPRPRAVIIGAGPAGLTAAGELLQRTSYIPHVYEADEQVGGIARTVQYKGFRMDIGGHRFFSKSDRVMNWWQDVLPIQKDASGAGITYHHQRRALPTSEVGPDPETTDEVMLVRQRLSRILYGGKFYDYPVNLNGQTIRNLGWRRLVRIAFDYFAVVVHPIRPERTLEDFYINRFGRELYRTFFRDYTQKVWGVACKDIPREWGAQRVKGLSIWSAIRHLLTRSRGKSDVRQKGTETSLIEQFLYPKYGPGQMWEVVANRVVQGGGTIAFGQNVESLHADGNRIVAATVRNRKTGERKRVEGEQFFSTMPIRDLIATFDPAPPPEVRRVAAGLAYRDFVTVGIRARRTTLREPLKDNWIYVQEPSVRVGRIQVFNNWSPYLVPAGDENLWLGLEYFCTEGDDLWRLDDQAMATLAKTELERIGIVAAADVLDAHVVRMKKTYPAYFGTYAEFSVIRQFLDQFVNLWCVGRNGMHKYNNQDHSMLTAMTAVENIVAGRTDKANVWAVNTEEEYHEKK